ncbi:MAG: hypothetical protein QOF34_1216 [Sphingomonadales bacterium]|nr:hypothetical protein [Sphingomonadales bacterium]
MNPFLAVLTVLLLLAAILYVVHILPLAPRGKHVLRVTAIVVGVLVIMRQFGFL